MVFPDRASLCRLKDCHVEAHVQRLLILGCTALDTSRTPLAGLIAAIFHLRSWNVDQWISPVVDCAVTVGCLGASGRLCNQDIHWPTRLRSLAELVYAPVPPLLHLYCS
jgi:hypothetical protein